MNKNFTTSQMKAAWIAADYRCERCGKYHSWDTPIPHHRKPKSLMSKEEVEKQQSQEIPDNCCCLCHSCHRTVHDKPKENGKWILHRWQKIEER